ncbi:MAG: rRNA pseudouridine synthase [Bacteroidales bacterium]|nr:rRNA pseudouridine synthase [Bacteroidales bacterium]
MKRQKGKSHIKKSEEKDFIRLNKYISNSGLCSRREADKLITEGKIKVNGKGVRDLGTRIKRNDKVEFGKQLLKPEKLRYVLLNKPKDIITTMDDPEGRKTVADITEKACNERIMPVGRLDRNTTGLLLLTNDGNMADKLTHPSSKIRKIYEVHLDKPVTKTHLLDITQGLQLEDGFAQADAVAWINPKEDKSMVGIEIHSGRNRIVRRIFEHLGYNVKRLDRTQFAGLTKKDLPRGRWRHLTIKEISYLKML